MDKLLDSGVISPEEYENLMDMLVELANSEGTEFERKARELSELLRSVRK